jgi:hypothetical protein
MKKLLAIIVLAALAPVVPLLAQGMPGGSPMGDALEKVFGTNLNFSATMQTEITTPQRQKISMAGKIYLAGGNTRTEMDMTQMTGAAIPPQAIAQMKAMGMDKMTSISLGKEKTIYLIYPNMQAYAKIAIPGAGNSDTNDFKVESVVLGKETVTGHPCVKEQYTVTDNKTGQQMTLTTWNATDLRNIPIQVKQTPPGRDGAPGPAVSTLFTDINLSTPSSSLFIPPSSFTAYDDLKTMVQTEAMKKKGGGAAGMPAK